MARLQLLQRLAEHASEKPDAAACSPAAANAGAALSWRQLESAVRFWANQFGAQLDPRQTLVISTPNCPEAVVAFLAALSAGLRVFPMSPELSATEIARNCDQSDAAGAVVSPRARESLASRSHHVWPIEQMLDGIQEIAPLNRPAGDLILQSSGTTGFPRLVLRTGKSLDAVSRQMAEAIGFSPDDRVLAMLPLSHSYGLEHGLLAPIWAGSTVLLGQGLDIGAITRQLAAGATMFPTVPSVIEILSGLPGDDHLMPSLRRIYSAGGPLPPIGLRNVFEALSTSRITALRGH